MPSVMVLALSQVAPAFARGAFGLIRCATTVSVLLALFRSRLYAGSAEIPASSRASSDAEKEQEGRSTEGEDAPHSPGRCRRRVRACPQQFFDDIAGTLGMHHLTSDIVAAYPRGEPPTKMYGRYGPGSL